MFSFSGKPNQRKVDLRGRSRGEESREQVLERTRAEREKRSALKLQNQSALLIQSHWRQLAAARKLSSELRQAWAQLCGQAGSRQALQELLARDPSAVSALLHCYDAKQSVDREALAALCGAVLNTPTGPCSLSAAAAGASSSAGTQSAAAGPSNEQLALYRVQKLALLCLSTLSQGGTEAAFALNSPYTAATSSPQPQQQQQQPMVVMLGFLIKVVNQDTWKASIQAAATQQPGAPAAPDQAAAAAAGAKAVLQYLIHKQLTARLRMLLLAVPVSSRSRTYAQACVAQLLLRALQLQLLPVKRQAPQGQHSPSPPPPAAAGPADSPARAASPAPSAAAAAAAAYTPMQLGASQLLCVPSLWSRAPALEPVAGRLCNIALAELSQLQDSKQFTDALLQDAVATPHGSSSSGRSSRQQEAVGAAAAAAADAAAVAVAAVAENLIEAAAAEGLLKGLSTPEQVLLAQRLVSMLVLLLDAAKRLFALQRQHARSKVHKHNKQQQQAQGRSIYDTGAGQVGGKKSGYVPGAGFVGQGQREAAADMEVDAQQPSMPGALTGAATAALAGAATAVAAAAAGTAAAAAGPGAGTEAMDVDRPTSTAQPPPSPSPEPGAGAAAGAAGAGTANAAAGAAADKAKVSQLEAVDNAVREQPVAASAWSAEADGSSSSNKDRDVPASEACMQLLAGSRKGIQLLRVLVATLLPATSPAQAHALKQQLLQQQQQPQNGMPAAAAGMPGSAAQQQLLELIWGLSRAPKYRQKVWLGLGVGARLVPRLWYSLVLPLHLSTPGGLLYYTGTSGSGGSSGARSSSGGAGAGTGGSSSSSGGAAGGPGSWALPLLVLCQAFSAALSFTHVEDFYLPEGGPLLVPVSQLYDSAAPPAGLVMLVKAAVWQVLWFNSLSPPGLPPPPLASAAQQLKTAVAEVCGLLLCQLHDRNCVREFCPAAAFLCDLAATAPARLQAEVAAAAVRMGAQGLDSDEEGDGTEDHAWQQQQQWQQQRQQGLGPLAAAAGPEEGSLLGSGGGSNVGNAAADGSSQGTAAAGAATAVSPSGGGGRSPGSRVWVVLEHAPCLVPFELRVQLLQHVLEFEKQAAEEAGEVTHMWDDPLDFVANRFVTIRRHELVEDGFTQIGPMDPDRIKGRLRIQYVNEAGLPEAGIDGGGLFKDFMEELLRQGFSPQAGLMAENPQHQLYPNPAAFTQYSDAEHRLGFLGRMLGKCLYEGMLLELPLADFFLKKMRGGVCDINDMPALDPEVYKHLLQLRHYTGDFGELSLTFTATLSDAGPTRSRPSEVELKPGGRDIAVTRDNVVEYIHRLADFRLNRQMDRAAAAFLRGFFDLIKPRWVRMFNEAELQMLISGSEEGLDVEDLMQHTNYAGGYHEDHPVVHVLWQTLRGFTPQEQRQFLKFVTSCSRAPLLGFAYLEPRICVQMSGGMLQPGATQRLPTAATCMNLLKLPPYRTVKEMREKLLYAISAGAGFELS